MKLHDLKKPFPPEDIEWRIGMCGKKKDGSIWAKALAYITARAIHDRLDEVCRPENWQLKYHEHLGETVCMIGVKVGDEWVWKSGGANKTDFEAFKGGLSSSEKRAGVPWGIGRYLYNLKESFVETSLQKKSGWKYQSANQKKGLPAFYWQVPTLPKWALPGNTQTNQPAQKTVKHVTEEEAETLMDIVRTTGTDQEKFLKWCGASSFFTIPENKYEQALDLLEEKEKQNKAA